MATLFQILQFFDDNGDPLSGGKLYWYQAGTAIAKDTYVDQGESAPLPNPVVLDSEGRELGGVWLNGSYKLIIKDSSDVTIDTLDNINEYDQQDWTGLTATIADLNSTTTTSVLKNTAYTVVVGDRGKTILCNATGGAFNISLPAAATAGNKFKITIKKIDTSTNAVGIDGSGTETTDAETIYYLYDYLDFIEAHCDGSNWHIVAKDRRGTTRAINSVTILTLSDDRKLITCDASGGAFNVSLPSAVTVGSGYEVTIKKTDNSANAVTVVPNGTQTIDGDASLAINDEDVAITFKSNGANWWVKSDYIINTSSTFSLPRLYMSGFVLSNNTVDPSYDIDISAGECRSYDDTTNMSSTSSFTKRSDGPWAQGTNQGGMASGLAIGVSTWYHVFCIAKVDGTIDFGFDSATNAANLMGDPIVIAAGFTKYRRIGSFLSNAASTVTEFLMYENSRERIVYWKTPIQDFTETNVLTTRRPITLRVPLGINTMGIFTALVDSTVSAYVYFTSTDMTDVTPSLANGLMYLNLQNNSNPSPSQVILMADTSSQIYYRKAFPGGVAATSVVVSTSGYYDNVNE